MFVDGELILFDLFAIGLTTRGKLYVHCFETSFWTEERAREAMTHFLHTCIKHGADQYTLKMSVVTKRVSLTGIDSEE
jgi:hypothetical protein